MAVQPTHCSQSLPLRGVTGSSRTDPRSEGHEQHGGQSEVPVGGAADDALASGHITSSRYEYGTGAYIIILCKSTSLQSGTDVFFQRSSSGVTYEQQVEQNPLSQYRVLYASMSTKVCLNILMGWRDSCGMCWIRWATGPVAVYQDGPILLFVM